MKKKKGNSFTGKGMCNYLLHKKKYKKIETLRKGAQQWDVVMTGMLPAKWKWRQGEGRWKIGHFWILTDVICLELKLLRRLGQKSAMLLPPLLMDYSNEGGSIKKFIQSTVCLDMATSKAGHAPSIQNQKPSSLSTIQFKKRVHSPFWISMEYSGETDE